MPKQSAKPPENPAFDDVLRRMLGTPPDPKTKPKKAGPTKAGPAKKPIKRKAKADRG